MTLLRLLRECKARNIALSSENGRLHVNAPDGALDTTLRDAIKSLEGQLLTALAPKTATAHSASFKKQPEQPPARINDGVFPLSEYQRPIWAAYEQGARHASMLSLAESFDLDRSVTVEELREAFQWIAERHDMLRARFSIHPERGVEQSILSEVPVAVTEARPSVNGEGRDEMVRHMLSSVMSAPYSLERDALFRVGLVNGTCKNGFAGSTVLVGISHIIGDAVSLQVIVRDLERYLDYLDGVRPLPVERPAQYADYLRMLAENVAASETERSLSYWGSQLRDLAPVHSLPTDYRRPVNRQAPRFECVTVPLPCTPLQNQALHEKGVSSFVHLLTVLQVTLFRFAGVRKVPLITPMANRHRHSCLEDVVGCFANEVVLPIPLEEDAAIDKALLTARNRIAETLDHQEVPFSQILQHFCPSRTPDWLPIAQIFFSYLDFSGNSRATHRFEPLDALGYDLSFILARGKATMNLAIGFDTSLFKRDTIELLAGLFNRTYATLAAHSHLSPVDLPSVPFAPAKQSSETCAGGDPLREVLKLCEGGTALLFRDESAPVLTRIKDRLIEEKIAIRILDGMTFPEVDGNSVLFSTGNIERIVSLPENTRSGTPRVCLVNHLPAASTLQYMTGRQKEVWLLLEMPSSLPARGEETSFGLIPFAEVRALQGNERFIGCLVKADQRIAAPGEMIHCGEGLRAISLGPGKLYIPLPAADSAHIWRNGYSMDLDALSAKRSYVEGQALALSLSPSPRPGETTEKLVEWTTPDGRNTRNTQEPAGSLPTQPDYKVILSAIPLTDTGDIDRQALSHLPIVSEPILRELEEDFASYGILGAKLKLGKQAQASARLHHSDLLPETDNVNIGGRYSALDVGNGAQTGIGEQRLSQIHTPALQGELSISFREYMERFADRQLIFIGNSGKASEITGRRFLDRALHLLGGMQRRGMTAGTRAILFCDREEELLCLAWACLMGGICMTALLPPMDGQNPAPVHARLRHIYTLLGKPPIISTNDLELPFTPETLCFYKELASEKSGFETASELHDIRPETLVYTAFTSGSTGTPKGVPLTAGNVFSMIHAKSRALGSIENETILSMTGLDHVASLFGHSFLSTARGARQVYCSFQYALADPLRILDIIDTYRVNQTWAPDFTWRHLHENLRRRGDTGKKWDLRCVRYLISGGESTREATFSNLERSLLPYGLPSNVFLHSWGMSETSSFYTMSDAWDSRSHASHLGIIDAGRPLAGMSVRVADKNGAVLPEGAIGSLQVAGPSVFSSYLDNPEANAESFTKDGWFITGDLAVMKNGKTILCGRQKEQVVIKGQNISQFDIEGMVDGIDGVEPTFSVVVGCKNENTGDDAVLIFIRTKLTGPQERAKLIRRVSAEVSSHYGIVPRHVLLVDAESVPKAALGKIQRTRILEQFIRGGFSSEVRQADLLLQNTGTVPDWFAQKQWERVNIPGIPCEGAGVPALIDAAECGHFVTAGPASDLAKRVAGNLADLGLSARHTNRQPDKDCRAFLHEALEREAADGHPATLLYFLEPEPSPENGKEAHTRWIERSFVPLYLLMTALAISTRPLRELAVISCGGQALHSRQTSGPWSAALIGLTSSLPRAGGIKTRLIDVEGVSEVADSKAILAEMLSNRTDNVTAWRGEKRYVPLLRRVAFPSGQSHFQWDKPFAADRYVLCTGMTGHLGGLLLPQLLLKTRANYLLLGRRESGQTVPFLANVCGHVPGWEKRVLYAKADLDDAVSIQTAMDQAARFFSRADDNLVPPGAVLHLAADTGEHDFSNLWATALVEAMRARERHMTNIENAFVRNGGSGPRIVFSSIVSHWGGANSVQYAPLCALAEALAHNHNASANISSDERWHCITWSRWQGLSEVDDPVAALMEKRGFKPIDPERALVSLLGLLRCSMSGEGGLYFAGIDPAFPEIASRMRNPGHAVRPVHTVEISSATNNETRLRRVCEERMGRGAPIRMSEPGDQDIDTETLSASWNGKVRGAGAKVERGMMKIWRDVLQLGHVDPTANFFELGGTSLHVPRLRQQILETFKVDVGSVGVFHFPCVREMSRAVADMAACAGEDLPAGEKHAAGQRADKQRLARAARR